MNIGKGAFRQNLKIGHFAPHLGKEDPPVRDVAPEALQA
jgi:hypothetical protein